MHEETPAPECLKLRLYVAGTSPNSLMARRNLEAICESAVTEGCELEIVDLLAFPLRALADGIVVTPTLLRLAPLPTVRLIGNLSDASKVLLLLRPS